MPKRSLPKPRIFISHSAHEQAAKDVLNHLVASLTPDFEVLFDKGELLAGDEWRDKVFTLMNEAHSAVILFSQNALESDWVRTEAGILTWRQTLDRGKTFKVIPVLLDPVKRPNLEEKKFSPMRLTTLQLVRSDDHAQIAQEVSAGLQHLIGQQPPETPFEKLVQKIASKLQTLKAAQLLQAARAMNTDVSGWSKSTEYPTLLAREMLQRGLAAARLALLELDTFLSSDDTRSLVELIAPAWVNLDTASAIPQIATHDDDTSRVLWVNGGDEYAEFTASHFIRRACCRLPEKCWPVLPIPNDSGEDEIGYYKRAIRESIKSKVVRVENAKDSLVQSVLKTREKEKEPVFVVFYPPGPALEVITALRTEFPTVTFFILAGNQTTGGAAGRLPADVEFLKPVLQPGEEEEAYAQYITTIGYGL